MTASRRLRHTILTTLRITCVAMILGALFGYALSSYVPSALLTGAAVAFLTATPLSLFELLLVAGPTGIRMRRAPFVMLLLVRSLVYGAIAYFAYVIGRGMVNGFAMAFAVDALALWSLVYSLVFSLVANFVGLARRLAGPGVIAHFVTGRYHRPRPEQRSFLLLDIAGSSAFAERIGPARFHSLLNAVMYDIADAVLEQEGEIYKYVGDEAIVSWLAPPSGTDPRPLLCLAAVTDRLRRRASDYEAEFGQAVRLRAGLHAGEVVTGELGDMRQEIAMVGDALNTAARLVDVARESGAAAVATAISVDLAALPRGWTARPLGKVALRGKETQDELVALAPPD
jgi:adenylate cyclase